jgi:hypothetical protein
MPRYFKTSGEQWLSLTGILTGSTQLSLSYGIHVGAGGYEETIASREEMRSPGCRLSRGINLFTGSRDEFYCLEKSMKLRVLSLSRCYDINIVAGSHDKIVVPGAR